MLLLIICSSIFGQIIVHGNVQDAVTGEGLPAANIQIEGTHLGTISNENGDFILNLVGIPATIKISYIGYATQQLKITESYEKNYLIKLQPIAYQLDPIIISAEDPAIRIMREVIKRKKIWRANLKTYRAEAYTRVVFENDTSVTSIMESISTSFWHKEKGLREVILSKRQTSNIEQNENFAQVSNITNLYDDNIEFAGFSLMGVTHPDALNHYDFKLEGQRKRDDKIVFDISVKPKSKLQCAFVGRIAVLDEEFAMLEVELQPSEAVMFPPPVQHWELNYQQQYDNFGDQYWVPIDVRTTGVIKIGLPLLQFPSIKIKRISRLTDYHYNIDLPDTLYQKKKTIYVDSTKIYNNPDSIFFKNPEVVPLTLEEEEAYLKLDSTRTLARAYQPSGPLSKFVKIEDQEEQNPSQKRKNGVSKILTDLEPLAGFNRVNGWQLGLKKSAHFTGRLNLYVAGGYYTGDNRWFYDTEVRLALYKKNNWQLRFNYSNISLPRSISPNYALFFTSIHALLGFGDYFDYYWNKKAGLAFLSKLPVIQGQVSLGLKIEQHSSLKETTRYNLLGKNIILRKNPAIPEGTLNSLQLKIVFGENYVPLGVVGQNRVELFIEHSSPDLLQSDFEFTQYKLMLDFRIHTFFRRRLMPNVLDVHLLAGTSSGDLPPQRFGEIDGALQAFSPFGVIKTLLDRPYEGEKYFGFFMEHNFRTIPFEIVGWRWAAEKNLGIIFHGAVAKSWTSNKLIKKWNFDPSSPDEFHREVGLSLSGLFNFLRIDGSYRLDKPGLYVGFGMTRFF
jgi:hypothetical protein